MPCSIEHIPFIQLSLTAGTVSALRPLICKDNLATSSWIAKLIVNSPGHQSGLGEEDLSEEEKEREGCERELEPRGRMHLAYRARVLRRMIKE
jgi:hypothetical protein